ncbi:metal ABC transporter permease [Candidatus Falkowbacteria bacterium]|nr:metal ABC transporter permease [Candidatus Falkowbacteria bacterium]
MNYQLILTIVSGIFISGIAAYLGTLMLSKKMSVVAGPLAHLALPGVALALLCGFEISIGVFPFVILGAILIWFLERKTNLPTENLAAIVFAFGVGSALLILPIGKAEEALVGSIDTINLAETITIVLLSIAVFFLVNFVYRKIMLVNIHAEIAKVEGFNVDSLNFLYLLSIAMVVGLGVYLVGGLITAALIAIPSATAKNVSNDLSSYKQRAVIFGVVATIGGIFIAPICHFPIGPAIIILGALFFLVTVFLNKKL